MKKAITIAGSDSGAGAGIQADLKTFSALGVYASTVITSVTAQNTVWIYSKQDIAPEVVESQLEAVFSDIGADAVKIGMLPSPEHIGITAGLLEKYRVRNLVLDPVLSASTGFELTDRHVPDALIQKLLPLVGIITPNLPEACRLAGIPVTSLDGMKEAARILKDKGAGAVLVKGGHLPDRPADVFYDGSGFTILESERVQTCNSHGTGCTLSSAIAAYLAKGEDMPTAVCRAREFILGALENSISIGRGSGPVNHFHALGLFELD